MDESETGGTSQGVLPLRQMLVADVVHAQGSGTESDQMSCNILLTVHGANVPPASSGNAGRYIPTG